MKEEHGSILNFIPLDNEGFMIELCPGLLWRWSIRFENYVMKCVSSDYFIDRESAYEAAFNWWNENRDTYWS